MLDNEIRSVYLVDELQLGNRLNNSLQGSDRADFDLLLAMLSQDVLDNPRVEDPKLDNGDVDLRAKFELQPEIRKYAQEDDYMRADQQSDLMHKEGHRAVFFAQCLNRDPLTPMKYNLAPDVYNQFSPLKQEKIRRYFEGEELDYSNRVRERGDGFLVVDEIQEAKKISVDI